LCLSHAAAVSRTRKADDTYCPPISIRTLPFRFNILTYPYLSRIILTKQVRTSKMVSCFGPTEGRHDLGALAGEWRAALKQIVQKTNHVAQIDHFVTVDVSDPQRIGSGALPE
jgi:hypothetical protein